MQQSKIFGTITYNLILLKDLLLAQIPCNNYNLLIFKLFSYNYLRVLIK